MLKNFLKTALRNIARHRGFSFINIAGLTLGLSACLLIGLFVHDEYSYDKFLPNGAQVYRIYNHYTDAEGATDRAVAPPMFATSLKQDFPEVEAVARVMMLPENKRLFEAGKTKLYEAKGYLVDSTFFDVFALPLKYGDVSKALINPTSIVLSESFAKRFFGNANPVGKQIMLDKSPFTVSAVVMPNDKFHLQFNYLVNVSTAQIPAERMQSWGWQQFYNYAKLKPSVNVQALQSKFKALVKQKSAPFMHDKQGGYSPIFQQLGDIHLYSAGFKFDVDGQGNITYVRALTIIAAFILLIACFNFVNLATAKSLQRAKEVGVRKSIGAGKAQLIMQFIGETTMLSCISIVLAASITALLLPWLNQFTGKHIEQGIFLRPAMLGLLLCLGLVTGIVAGFYPALVLSAFKPVKVLKSGGAADIPGGNNWLRHSLVVVQFTLSALLIISSIIVFRQVSFLHNKNLGFNKDEIMFFPMRGDKMFGNSEAFKTRLMQVPGVSSVSIGYGFPGDAVAGDDIMRWKNGKWESGPATQLMVDYDYIKTLGLAVVAGRGFEKERKTDKDNAFMINETAVKALGFGTPEKALGQKLAWSVWGARNPDSLKTGTVIGVVKDFNYKSLYDKVEITVMQIFPDAAWKVAVKLNGQGIQHTISGVEKAWDEFSPQYPLEYNFLDGNFEKMYRSEDKLQSLIGIFTTIAILVGCMGLFGLAAYTAERRRREIGIRKVLGATVSSVVTLLSKGFLKLVAISLLIASPVAWVFMDKWLQNFAYRINISWWVFGLAALIALVIAFVTVGYQALKAAVVNPVKSLRAE